MLFYIMLQTNETVREDRQEVWFYFCLSLLGFTLFMFRINRFHMALCLFGVFFVLAWNVVSYEATRHE